MYHADGFEEASGQWRDGKQRGHGKIIFPNGDRYEGEFVDDKYSGLGAFTWADGRVHEGEWADDKPCGLGVEWGKHGKFTQCGRWVNSQFVAAPVPLSKIPIGLFLCAAGEPRRRAARTVPDACGAGRAQIRMLPAATADAVGCVWLQPARCLSARAAMRPSSASRNRPPH